MSSLKGKLLIASPHLLDPNFVHTVVLMIQHDEEGAFGVVLNRPSDSTVGQVWTEALECPCDCPDPIFLGGPCPGPLMAIHQHPNYSDLTVSEGVYFATQKENLETLVEEKVSPVRVYSGYAGWAGGQLEGELEAGSWLLADAADEAIFGDQDALWKILSRKVGQDILFSTLHIKHPPEDPALN